MARVRYGFGAGGGTGPFPSGGKPGAPEAGEEEGAEAPLGSGGGVEVSPVGIIEITAAETRFISFEDRRRIIKAGLIGFLVAAFLFRRRRRR